MQNDLSVSEKMALLTRGISDLVSAQELEAALSENRILNLKLGIDPTAPDLHLGHTVVVNKMRQFQDLGHQVTIIIGDFTAMIGDPSGRNSTRPQLSREQILENAKEYQTQFLKILIPEKTKFVYNSAWFDKFGAQDFIRLASQYTVARLMERDDFAKRFREQQPIAVHELIYPLLQGHDSVMINADMEFGGNDQRFNLLVGRELQRQRGLRPQMTLTMPLLEGLDGVKKMSKSYNNYIGVYEPPEQIFGKIMSISDKLMWRYFTLLSRLANQEIAHLEQEVKNGRNPRDVKVLLAKELVARFYDQAAADRAEQEFNARFKENQLPENIPLIERPLPPEGIKLRQLLRDAGLVPSASEATRLINQRGVSVNQTKVEDADLTLTDPGEYLIQVGKLRFMRIKLSRIA